MYAWMYHRIFQFQEYIHVLSIFMYPRGHVAVQSDPRSGASGALRGLSSKQSAAEAERESAVQRMRPGPAGWRLAGGGAG